MTTLDLNDPGDSASTTVPSPSVFMRDRRPGLYSDSVDEPLPPMERAAFEFYLDQITARKEEARFERFARALLEVTLCPNLLPQTGPTGGGDSKVDSETYPVADSIAARWYSGSAREASEERWAFAISAKRDWQSKATNDIKSIVSTDRGYKRIYFITNQAVSDRSRAKKELALSKLAKCDVRIFDRTWIVEAVYNGRVNRWAIVEDAFGIQNLAKRYDSKLGPNDARATAELARIDEEIADQRRFRNSSSQLIEAWLSSALCARRLERSRDEIEDRFSRAIELADKLPALRVARRARYELAWTRYWWFDDPTGVLGLYDAIETNLDDDANAWDLEQLTSLYITLSSAETHGWLPPGTASLQAKAARLEELGARLAARRSHPTDAAWARTQGIIRRANDSLSDPLAQDSAIAALRGELTDIRRLVEYPVKSLNDFVEALGEIASGRPNYEALADDLNDILAERAGQQTAALNLLNRSRTALRAERPYDTIRLLGRAWEKMNRREARDAYISGSVIAARAFEGIGLLWAARAHLVLALNRSFRSYTENSELDERCLPLLEHLAWLELQLGRIPEYLQVESLAQLFLGGVATSDDIVAAFSKEAIGRGASLSLLVLHSSFSDLPALQNSPAVFRAQQQEIAECVALHLLGDKEASDEISREFEGGAAALFRESIGDQFAHPIWGHTERLSYSAQIAGCRVTFDLENQLEAIAVAESVLGAMESFLATYALNNIHPATDEVVMTLDLDPEAEKTTCNTVENEFGDTVIHIRVGVGATNDDGSDELDLKSLANVIAQAVSSIALLEHVDMGKLNEQDRILERAFGMLRSIQASASLMGWRDRWTWTSLTRDVGSPTPYTRSEWWPDTCPKPTRPSNVPGKAPKAPITMVQHNEQLPQVSHRVLQFRALIRPHLWDRAKWGGAGYITAQDPEGREHVPPRIQFIFGNRDAATKIARGLDRKLGRIDRDDSLRLIFLTGIDRNHPSHYRVALGPNMTEGQDDGGFEFMVMRLHTMLPTDTSNLDRFWGEFELTKCCILSMAVMDADGVAENVGSSGILMRCVSRKEAWTVGENDPDQMAILPSDFPVIPTGVTDAPVARLFQQRAKRSDSSKH